MVIFVADKSISRTAVVLIQLNRNNKFHNENIPPVRVNMIYEIELTE